MDQRTRKVMTMHKAQPPRDDVERQYVSRKEGGRGLASIEDYVEASIQRLEDCIKKTRARTNYNHQKRYGQHDRRKNDKNEETKNGRKNNSLSALNV